MSSSCVLLVFVDAFSMCFVGVHRCSLVVFCWCSLTSFCCALLLFIDTFLLCFFVVYQCFPSVGLAKVRAKNEARESHFMLPGVWESVRD
jgi:hypothetical protein